MIGNWCLIGRLGRELQTAPGAICPWPGFFGSTGLTGGLVGGGEGGGRWGGGVNGFTGSNLGVSGWFQWGSEGKMLIGRVQMFAPAKRFFQLFRFFISRFGGAVEFRSILEDCRSHDWRMNRRGSSVNTGEACEWPQAADGYRKRELEKETGGKEPRNGRIMKHPWKMAENLPIKKKVEDWERIG